MGYTPSLHLLQAKLDELNNQGFDIHTVSFVLYDDSVWLTRIEATDDDLENHVWHFDLDRTGWDIKPTPADLLAVRR